MKLLTSLTSPYGRKLRVVIAELGLNVPVVETQPLDNAEELLAANPLGKVPALVLEDGGSLVDSTVIAAYLLSLVPGQKLLPESGLPRWQVRSVEALADGVLDAAIVLRMNAMQGVTDGAWPQRQRQAIDRALAALARQVHDDVDYAMLCTIIALEYLDFRFPEIDWRRQQPRLAELHDWLSERPSLKATRPPG